MKTIIITGPSGSGKSYLCKKLSKIFNDSIVIKTDSYYRDNLLIRFLSMFIYDIYDRPMSIKKKEIKNIFRSLQMKDSIVSFTKYDFKRKHSSKSKVSLTYKGENQFIIIEGIFAHRLDLNYQEAINIICEEKKEICFKRRLNRDKFERGRDTNEVQKKFNSSWYLFYENVRKYLNKNKILKINPSDKISYEKLVIKLQQLKKNN